MEKQEQKQEMQGEKQEIRQPIVTVAGHIDHGKTTLLDCIRGTCIAEKEPGLITQKISSTLVPAGLIKEKCKKLLEAYNIEVEIPGFLFVDTPGHAAFTNLRKRGGALADLAILVVDINEGIMEQTKESIEVMKANKLPFIVALNKIDKISGWTKKAETLAENIEKQASFTRLEFEKKFSCIIAQLASLGFDSDLFFRIKDFTKQLALIPCSAKTGEGIIEILAMLAGLAQRFLKGRLLLSEEGKGTILEIKKEKGFTIIEAILYDGKIKLGDNLLVASPQKIIEAKVRALFEALPLGKGFIPVKEARAATGIRFNLVTDEDIIPGMPFVVAKKEVGEINSLQQEIGEILKPDKEGIIAKADSLGSLEALLYLLRKEGIQIKRAGVGNIKKEDIAFALTLPPIDSVIVAFNVTTEPGIEKKEKKVKIIEGNVIYKIVEQLIEWKKEKLREIEREKLSSLTFPCKIKVLPFVFRQSKPAIFGIKVEAGTLKVGTLLMNDQGKEIDKVKSIQIENKNVDKAEVGLEVAICLPKITFGRQIKEGQILYAALHEKEFREIKKSKECLTKAEIEVLKEIAEIKRKIKPTWGI